MPDGMEHDIVREGAVGGDGATLGVDIIVGGRKLVQEVEGLEAEDELAAEEWLAYGGVNDEIVAVEVGSAVATTAVHATIS